MEMEEWEKLLGKRVKVKLGDCCIVGHFVGTVVEVGEESDMDITLEIDGLDKVSFYTHAAKEVLVV